MEGGEEVGVRSGTGIMTEAVSGMAVLIYGAACLSLTTVSAWIVTCLHLHMCVTVVLPLKDEIDNKS